jgi:multiple sugar transport system substrate-binding protein
MKTKKLLMAAALASVSSFAATGAQAEDLTLCWAAWDPANALVEGLRSEVWP